MNYGTVIKPKELLDEDGSSRQETITYRGGVAMHRTRYEMRVRVSNETDELAEYVKHKKEHKDQNIEFKVERGNTNKDYYYVVKVWEE